MDGYLGTFDIDPKETKFANFSSSDWAMYFLEKYGQIDGAHHKAWTLDQIARILKGTHVLIKQARWENGQTEYRCYVDKPSQEYEDWVEEMLDRDEDGEAQYDYDIGIAP